MTFQIMTDVTSDLPQSVIKKNHLLELGMDITIGKTVYRTVGENRLTLERLFAELDKGQRAVTSAVGTGEIQEAFRKLAKAGIEVLYLTFSSGLSGTYQSANIAREAVLEEFPEAKITVVDSLAAASGEGYLLEEVLRQRESGKSVEEIVELLKTVIPRLRSWFMVNDLNFLARGGRISKTSAIFGTMANIKPVLDVDPTGHLRTVSKVRGSKKAINSLIANTIKGFDSKFPRIIVAYSGSSEAAEAAKAEFLKALPNISVDVRPLGPVISAHTGSGALAIFSVGSEIRK